MIEREASAFLDVASDVAGALADRRPVVALESTIISHGMPYPRNVDTALRVQQAVRDHGAMPATIAVLGGKLKVGLTEDEVERLGERGENVIKTSRRDLAIVLSAGTTGATTVAATMIVAAMAGIRVFATGGIGGVHRGAGETLDISADLDELARSNVAVVCAGIKSVLDIGRSLEYLETRGVPVIGFRTDELPAFYTRSSGHAVDHRADSAADIADIVRTKWDVGLDGGLVIANPIPDAHALRNEEVDAVIESAIDAMNRRGISGKDTTPFLLARIASETGGRSLDANIELVLNNARLAAEVAAAL